MKIIKRWRRYILLVRNIRLMEKCSEIKKNEELWEKQNFKLSEEEKQGVSDMDAVNRLLFKDIPIKKDLKYLQERLHI